MSVIECKPKSKSLVDSFSEALLKKDLQTIIELLADNGEFDIQTTRLNTLPVNKKRFVTWFKKRLKESEDLEISFDQCLHCSVGGTVLLINNGTFPRKMKDSSERSKTGLMIKVEDSRISQIKFCYVFAKTENKYAFEIKMEKINDLEEQGHSFWQAMRMIENESLIVKK